MRRKRVCAFLTVILCVLLAAASCSAGGVTLWTVSSFAGADLSAVSYTGILRAWEADTGNTVTDKSATSDEAWKTDVLNSFAAGSEPDILFFFAGGSDSSAILNKVVPIGEINRAYPDLDIPEDDLLREPDGQIYAVPVRPYYEGLFVNLDLFEQVGAELPETWEQFEAAIAAFRDAGIVPISVSLSDIPHYLAEFAILSCSSPEEYAARPASYKEVPQSWLDGMALLRRLWELGAFAEDAASTTEAEASRLFRDKKAAMQIDGSWFANTLSDEAMDTTAVLPFPARSEKSGGMVIGGTSMGFYLTRCAWESNRREAAVDLFARLTGRESRDLLNQGRSRGKLSNSILVLLSDQHRLVGPIQDAMKQSARETWLLKCILPVMTGRMNPEECWAQVMARDPFSD